MLAAGIELFQKGGFSWLFRWWHVVFGVAWIGLLYYFNFVQVPSFAQMDPTHRNGAIDKLVERALWWFRWAAAATFGTGLIVYGLNTSLDQYKNSGGQNNATLAGMLLGTIMAANVWMIIWPGQQVVIANARGVLAGQAANPDTPTHQRKALLASRTNALFSIPMLMFMTGASHFFPVFDANGGKIWIFWIIFIVVVGAVEANALGYIGGMQGQFTKLLEKHMNVIYGGIGLSVVFWLLWEILF